MVSPYAHDSQLLDLQRLPAAALDTCLDALHPLVDRVIGCDESCLRAFIEGDPTPALRKRISLVRRDGRVVGFTFYRLFAEAFGGMPGLVYESTACAIEPLGPGSVGLGPVLRDALGYKLVHPRARVGHREASLHLWRLERAGVVHFPVRTLDTDRTIRGQLARLGRGRLTELETAA